MRKSKKKRAASIKAKHRANITFRMNVLFFSIFLLFSLLILRLGYLQIVEGENFKRQLARSEEIPVNSSVPRGRIYDSFGRIMVDNEPKNAITYTKTSSTTTKEMLDIAEKLSKLIVKSADDITLRDKQDFWILKNKEEAYAKVSDQEEAAIRSNESLSKSDIQKEIDRLVRSRITEQELNSFTDEELEVLAIYREMAGGYNLSPQIIKSGSTIPKGKTEKDLPPEDYVSAEEFARVSERLSELKGVNTTTDWVRVPKSTLAILGRTTTPKEGIPKSKLDFYLAQDYSRNDRVGKSYIEAQYEPVLQGQKSVVKNITDRTGSVTNTETVFEGEPGKDLVLTIDSELQAKLEQMVGNELLTLKQKTNAPMLENAYLVMMDPYTGEILSMVGKKVIRNEETGKYEIQDAAYGTFTAAYEVGSSVKLASLLTGYDQGAIRMNEVQVDEPIEIAGTPIKNSIFNKYGRISLTDLQALERSSNVYMFKIGFSLANAVYRKGQPMRINTSAFSTVRNSFAQFGLGVRTGIDLPGEATGSTGPEVIPGKLMDLMIGQYDTYTPLQLAQYVSTVVNGGLRIKPHVVKEIRQPSEDGVTMGPLIEEVQPVVLNRIHNTQEQIEHVKKGMYLVYHGSRGTARAWFADAPYEAAGKTGTAEAIYSGPNIKYRGTSTINLTHIGYAPVDQPEVAYAVVVPWVPDKNGIHEATNNIIARQALDTYFAVQKQRFLQQQVDSVIQQVKPAFSDVKIDEKDDDTSLEQ